MSTNVTTQEGGNAQDEERLEDLVSAFGNQMGTFTGTWKVYLRDAKSAYAKEVFEHFNLAKPTEKAGSMYFTMTKLEVGRSASRCTITGPMGFTRFVSLEKQNTSEWWFAKHQHMISPF